jgi:hypothetical protein
MQQQMLLPSPLLIAAFLVFGFLANIAIWKIMSDVNSELSYGWPPGIFQPEYVSGGCERAREWIAGHQVGGCRGAFEVDKTTRIQ